MKEAKKRLKSKAKAELDKSGDDTIDMARENACTVVEEFKKSEEL